MKAWRDLRAPYANFPGIFVFAENVRLKSRDVPITEITHVSSVHSAFFLIIIITNPLLLIYSGLVIKKKKFRLTKLRKKKIKKFVERNNYYSLRPPRKEYLINWIFSIRRRWRKRGFNHHVSGSRGRSLFRHFYYYYFFFFYFYFFPLVALSFWKITRCWALLSVRKRRATSKEKLYVYRHSLTTRVRVVKGVLWTRGRFTSNHAV